MTILQKIQSFFGYDQSESSQNLDATPTQEESPEQDCYVGAVDLICPTTIGKIIEGKSQTTETETQPSETKAQHPDIKYFRQGPGRMR